MRTNDEYHVTVSPSDVWAEYHRLAKEEGWDYERIGDAKRTGGKPVGKATVSKRIGFHTSLCKEAKKACFDEKIDEGHCEAIVSLSFECGGQT